MPTTGLKYIGLHISRTVLQPEVAGLILSAASCLPLKTIELINTGLQVQSIPQLVSALQRPTMNEGIPHLLHQTTGTPAAVIGPVSLPAKQSLAVLANSNHNARIPVASAQASLDSQQLPQPGPGAAPRPLGPNWWLSLTDLDLSGNNLGDGALQGLIHHICEAKAIRKLTLKQVGMTDWLAPQVNHISL